MKNEDLRRELERFDKEVRGMERAALFTVWVILICLIVLVAIPVVLVIKSILQ